MTAPQRKAVPKTLSLSQDALELLEVLVPNRRAVGLFLSELVRREAEARIVRRRLLEDLREKTSQGWEVGV